MAEKYDGGINTRPSSKKHTTLETNSMRENIREIVILRENVMYKFQLLFLNVCW